MPEILRAAWELLSRKRRSRLPPVAKGNRPASPGRWALLSSPFPCQRWLGSFPPAISTADDSLPTIPRATPAGICVSPRLTSAVGSTRAQPRHLHRPRSTHRPCVRASPARADCIWQMRAPTLLQLCQLRSCHLPRPARAVPMCVLRATSARVAFPSVSVLSRGLVCSRAPMTLAPPVPFCARPSPAGPYVADRTICVSIVPLTLTPSLVPWFRSKLNEDPGLARHPGPNEDPAFHSKG